MPFAMPLLVSRYVAFDKMYLALFTLTTSLHFPGHYHSQYPSQEQQRRSSNTALGTTSLANVGFRAVRVFIFVFPMTTIFVGIGERAHFNP